MSRDEAEAALTALRRGLQDGTVAVDHDTPLEAARRAASELGLPAPAAARTVVGPPRLEPGQVRRLIRQWAAWRSALPKDVPTFPSGRRLPDYYRRALARIDDEPDPDAPGY